MCKCGVAGDVQPGCCDTQRIDETRAAAMPTTLLLATWDRRTVNVQVESHEMEQAGGLCMSPPRRLPKHTRQTDYSTTSNGAELRVRQTMGQYARI